MTRDVMSKGFTATTCPANLSALAPQSVRTAADGKRYTENLIQTPEALTFCNDNVSIDPPVKASTSMNQWLTTGRGMRNTKGELLDAYPVTKIAPVIVAPSHDLSYWRDNEMIVHSAINTEGVQKDMYLSGYAESTCCGYIGNGASLVPEEIKENYSMPCQGPQKIRAPTPGQERVFIPTIQENYSMPCQGPQRIRAPTPGQERVFIPTLHGEQLAGAQLVEGFAPDPRPNQPGWVNTSCGYNPSQIDHGLPSNLSVGNCQTDPALDRFNTNLFTEIVTPGVYTRTQVNEPINSNIGISFQQQFEPVSCKRDDKGLTYTQHDPRVYTPPPRVEEPQGVNYDNVYDPRFYGYGTSYRSYIDPLTGQPRFAYDDVNAVRHPNYIVRSKIDHLPYADQYGSVKEGSENGTVFTPLIRTLAQDSWLRDTLEFRNDMTERLMRKKNAEAWQRRAAPFGPRQATH